MDKDITQEPESTEPKKQPRTSHKPPPSFDLQDMLAKYDAGWSQPKLAKHFKKSSATINKWVRRERPFKSIDALSLEEQEYVTLKAHGDTSLEASKKIWPDLPIEQARRKASELLKRGDIHRAMTALMEAHGIGKDKRMQKLAKHVDSEDGTLSLKAIQEANKIDNIYPATQQVNVNIKADISPVNLDEYRLDKARNTDTPQTIDISNNIKDVG